MATPTPHQHQQRAWEGLRKDSRKVQGEIDSKLATYAKLSNGGIGAGGSNAADGDAIERLIDSLAITHDEMSMLVNGNDNRKHTLARQRDILLEYQQEFKRLKALHETIEERSALLGDVEAGGGGRGEEPLMGMGTTSSSNAVLRERATLGSMNTVLDDVIGQAQHVASSLTNQRRVFDGVNTKLATLGARFPLVNSLLGSIRRKKAKDTIILSIVIASCIVMFLIFWSR